MGIYLSSSSSRCICSVHTAFFLHQSSLDFLKARILFSPCAELPHVGPQTCHGSACPVHRRNSRYKGLKRQKEDQDSVSCSCGCQAPFRVGQLGVFFSKRGPPAFFIPKDPLCVTPTPSWGCLSSLLKHKYSMLLDSHTCHGVKGRWTSLSARADGLPVTAAGPSAHGTTSWMEADKWEVTSLPPSVLRLPAVLTDDSF